MKLFLLSTLIASTFVAAGLNDEFKCAPPVKSSDSSHSASSSSSKSCKPAPAPVPIQPLSPSKCTKELEDIVYVPPNGAYDYLNRLLNEFLVDVIGINDVYHAHAAENVILAFANKYGVSIIIQPPFSNLPDLLFTPEGGRRLPVSRKIGHIIPPTYLNHRSFQSQMETKIVNGNTVTFRAYSMAAYSQNAEGLGFNTIMSVNAKDVYPDC